MQPESSVRSPQPLHKVLAAVDTLVLLVLLGRIRPRDGLDEVLEIGITKVSVPCQPSFLLKPNPLKTSRSLETRYQAETHAMLYLAGYVSPSSSPSLLGGSTTLCIVLIIVSLLHRANKSPAFTTHVPSIGVASTNSPLGLLTCSPPRSSWNSSVIEP